MEATEQHHRPPAKLFIKNLYCIVQPYFDIPWHWASQTLLLPQIKFSFQNFSAENNYFP